MTLAAGSAQAFIITESTDFPGSVDFVGGEDLGSFDVGVNTLSGALDGECIDEGGGFSDCNTSTSLADNQDSVLVTVATGTQLDSIVLTTESLVVGQLIEFIDIGFQIRDETNTVDIFEFIPPDGLSSPNLLGFPGPIGAGVYAISFFGIEASTDDVYSLDYSAQFTVSAIDTGTIDIVEPWSLGLMMVGLAGLGLTRRKKAAR